MPDAISTNPRRCYVLDEDRELALVFEPSTRLAVRPLATAPGIVVAAGPVPLAETFGESRGGMGLLVLDGLIVREVEVAGRTAAELIGPGDLIVPWYREGGPLVPELVSWRALTEARMAVLDRAFVARTRPWPQIGDALMRRLLRRTMSLAAQQAIAAHPRVEERVALLLAHLADRWGRVEPDGSVRIPVPLTHRLIGELVGAERPTVSLAIGGLRRDGLLSGDRCAMRLHGDLTIAAEPPEVTTVRPLTDPVVRAATGR